MKSASLPSLIIIFLLVAASGCSESYNLSVTYTARATPTQALTVDNIAGSVRLTRGPVGSPISGVVKVHAGGFDEKAEAKAAAEAVEVIESLQGGELVLSVAIPADARHRTFAVTFDLAVPEDLIASVVTDDGRISIDGLIVGDLDTTRGEIDLAFTTAPAGTTTRLRSSDARITVDSHAGPLDVATTNAPIELYSIAGNTRASTSQGPITARVIPPPGGEVFLATTNSPIDLAIQRDFGARLLAVTSPPGAVLISGDLRFTPTSSFPDQAEGVIGNGAGRIDLRTTGADIHVHR